MKTFISIFAVCFSLLSVSTYSQTSRLEVKVDIIPELKKILRNQTIEVKLLGQGIISKPVSKSGIVVFDSLNGDEITVIISAHVNEENFEKDYSLEAGVVKLKNDSTIAIKIVFPEACNYNRNGSNRICPDCKKSDRVIPICYGLIVPLYDESGNLIKTEKEYIPGGDVIIDCNPTWYCKRDKRRF